jgi:cytochrome c biogenesis protein
MSVAEETITNKSVQAPTKIKSSFTSNFLKFLCSVRLGIILLVLLGLACLVGMLIMQENVDGFVNYYASLTPSQQLLYGQLDFFDIYHAWYFNTLLALLSLNIILASIDRFPKTWALISRPVLTPPLRWLRDQKQFDSIGFTGDKTEIASKIRKVLKKFGWRKIKIGEKDGRTFIYGERGAWNRLGYLAVHVGLLTIFLGGFLTAQLGMTGQMPLKPGQTSDRIVETSFDLNQVKEFEKRLPIEITCTDIQQKLIKKDGTISAGNTIDWLTRIQIKDGGEIHEAVVQMNRPFDYRGLRFFQASFVPVGRARNITVKATQVGSDAGQEITIPRDGASTLADGTQIKLSEFRGNFSIGQENLNEDTSDYPNPGAVLEVTSPQSKPQIAYAFGPNMADLPVAKKPVGGYTFSLVDFEKVSEQHILAVQYDPGATVVYLGFVILCLTLAAVFLFSHQRVWAVLETDADNNLKVLVGGQTNRNQPGFEEKFKRLVGELSAISS